MGDAIRQFLERGDNHIRRRGSERQTETFVFDAHQPDHNFVRVESGVALQGKTGDRLLRRDEQLRQLTRWHHARLEAAAGESELEDWFQVLGRNLVPNGWNVKARFRIE